MCKMIEARFSPLSTAGEEVMPGTAAALLQSWKDVSLRTNMPRTAEQKDGNDLGFHLVEPPNEPSLQLPYLLISHHKNVQIVYTTPHWVSFYLQWTTFNSIDSSSPHQETRVRKGSQRRK